MLSFRFSRSQANTLGVRNPCVTPPNVKSFHARFQFSRQKDFKKKKKKKLKSLNLMHIHSVCGSISKKKKEEEETTDE